MSQEALIAKLSSEVAPVSPLRAERYMGRVAMLWLAIAAVIVGAIDVRPDMGHMASIAKPAFFALVAAFLAVALFLMALPGRRSRHWLYALSAVLISGVALTAQALLHGGEVVIADAMARPSSLACMLSVGLFGLVPLYWIMRWLKQAAVCRPMCAGAMAGGVSGALAASAYALHCQQDALMYISIWYVSPILLLAGLGAIWGRKTLRW